MVRATVLPRFAVRLKKVVGPPEFVEERRGHEGVAEYERSNLWR
jgi:hypothetical protein